VSAVSRPALPASLRAPLAAARGHWLTIGVRERRLVVLALAVLGAYLLWVVAVQPAWRTLHTAPARLDALDAQLQQMQALASEARELHAAPALGPQQSAQALQAASERLGAKARLSMQGDRAVLTLNGVSSTQLREWLAEARAGARARPTEAQLSRNAQGYSGSIVLSLGAAR
jgi:general secretion pathway protein M